MCLAIPAQIISIDIEKNSAIAAVEGVEIEVSLALLDEVLLGDYVLIHVGYALQKIDEQEALKTLALFAEAGLEAGDEIHQ
ncbi:HypC/HybG/HupF family hydrogenase formation chaperone [Methylomonas sp. AM2-LC]|uniref:HypC/HybG/HupF family hydrogenase formation chaperone n=1 Tax=Methylomonas sp. AM2-LC TaxID=3153301 RepID=UPI00326307E9